MPDESKTNAPSRERVRELHGRGLSVRDIAAVMHVSTQRVYKQLRVIRDEDEQRESVA